VFDRLERPGLGETLTQNAGTDAKLHRELGSFVGYCRRTRLNAIAGGYSRIQVGSLQDDQCIGIAVDPSQQMSQFFIAEIELGP